VENQNIIKELISDLNYALIFTCRGIGAVVYKVPELENDQLLKISLRSEEKEDTTPITQVFPLSNS